MSLYYDRELQPLYEIRRYREDRLDYGTYTKRVFSDVLPPDRREGYGRWKPVQSSGRDVPASEDTPEHFELIIVWRAKPLRSR